MNLNRIVALLLCFVLMFGFLVSCQDSKKDDTTDNTTEEKPGEKPEEKPDDGEGDGKIEELPLDKYTISSMIAFSSDNEQMSDAIYGMNSSLKTNVDGENISIVHSFSTENTEVEKAYTLVGGILYHSTYFKVNDITGGAYQKATMSDGNKNTLLSDVGAGAGIGVTDFYSFDITNSNGKTTYICSDINDDAKESLLSIFSAAFIGYNASVVLNNVDFELEVEGERNKSSILSCSFTVIMDGSEFDVTMHIMNSYKYANDVTVSAPEGTDKYVETSYKDIIG